MDIKKILALTIIALALFSCMGAASAGLFDFLFEATEKHNFNGFTLDIPDGSKVRQYSLPNVGNYTLKAYIVKSDKHNLTVYVSEGSNLKEKYLSNWVSDGATNVGSHGNWKIIKEKSGSYCLVKYGNTRTVELHSKDLDFLKRVADSFKEV